MRAVRRTVAALAVTSAALALTACSAASDAKSAGSAIASQASAVASAATASPSGTKATPEEICAFLTQQLPNLQGKDKVTALAALTLALSGFADQHGGLANLDGAYLDSATQQQCPEVRSQVLAAVGVQSLNQV